MREIELEEAQNLLAPYHPRLLQCFDEGWKRYDDTIPRRLPLISSRGQANAYHEFLVEEVRTRLGGLEGILIDESKDNRFLVYVQQQLLLRFKKLDRKLRTSNYPTPTSVAFDAQEEIEGLPECCRLTVGYQFDRMRRGLKSVYVLYAKGREPLWHYDLRDPSLHQVMELPLERREKGREADVAVPRVKPKRVADSEERGGDAVGDAS